MNLDGLPRILDRLESCAVIGGFAMAARGRVRTTIDLDLLTTDARALDDRTWSPLRAQRTEVEIRRADLDEPVAGMVRVRLPGIDVDVVIGWDRWQQEIVERAETMPIAGMALPVATTDDLILLKLYAGGVDDMHDVANLLGLEPDGELVRRVDEALRDLPKEMGRRWWRLRAELGL
ncbi:MAG TPA: hypothetical protein VMS56_15545 [Thermoanaerobaculia bacterium]|nr:hypothetical protein [Thermoanaerobaculia bacterium]